MTAGLESDHALLIDAAREAGAIAMSYFKKPVETWDKAPGQPVSAADIAVNQRLAERLRGARPDYGWLSEEDADSDARFTTRAQWIVDPIDGTRAFLDGRAEFTIALALVRGGAPVAGVVFNPATDEMFEGFSGGGARLNGVAMRVTDKADLDGARMVMSRTEKRRADWPGDLDGVAFSGISSAAYKLALVAAGRFDLSVTLWPKNEWDAAAADILLSEAGGRLTDLSGAALVYNRPDPLVASLIAAGPTLHPVVLARLADRA